MWCRYHKGQTVGLPWKRLLLKLESTIWVFLTKKALKRYSWTYPNIVWTGHSLDYTLILLELTLLRWMVTTRQWTRRELGCWDDGRKSLPLKQHTEYLLKPSWLVEKQRMLWMPAKLLQRVSVNIPVFGDHLRVMLHIWFVSFNFIANHSLLISFHWFPPQM